MVLDFGRFTQVLLYIITSLSAIVTRVFCMIVFSHISTPHMTKDVDPNQTAPSEQSDQSPHYLSAK